MTGPTIRLVSGLERIWVAAGREAHMVIQAVLAPPAPLGEADWRRALDTLGRDRPALRLRWRGWLRRARWVAVDGPVPLRRVEDWDGRSPAAFLEAPLDPTVGPGAELVLAGRFAVLRMHHALTDGRGLWSLAQALLAALDDDAPRPVAAGPDTELDLVRQVAAPAFHEPPPDAANVFPARPAGYSTERAWRHRRLPVPRGVNARALVALRDYAGAPLRISVPVDLRRYRPGLASDANLTGIAHLDVPRDADVDTVQGMIAAAVDANRAAAHVRAADGVRGAPLWLMTWAARRAGRAALERGQRPVSATVSNLGRAPLTLRGTPVPAFVLPPANPSLPLLMVLVGGADAVECAVTAPRACADEAELDRLLDALEAAFSRAPAGR